MPNQTLSKKPLFNLSLVLQETGIKADTLRAWERRYQLPVPSRTEGGHRLFSSYDIETIKWLLARQEEGMRISQAVDYWRELIAAGTDPLANQADQAPQTAPTSETTTTNYSLSVLLRNFIDSALRYDDKDAKGALDQAFAQFPWEVVYTDLIAKGLKEVGERWYSGEISVQQEHFTSEIIVSKLHALIAGAPPPYHPQNVLITTPPGEFHIIAPLMINLLLRFRGWPVTYLGANVPDERLTEALDQVQPNLVVTTAARLPASAALLGTSKLIHERAIPLAFGGTIFSFVPDLAQKIPGNYLGPDLSQSISQIETLLSGQDEIVIQEIPSNPFQSLRDDFLFNLPHLEAQASLAVTQENFPDFSGKTLQSVNRFLFQDILAVLTLGDLDLLHPNIEWINRMLVLRSYGQVEFFQYVNILTTVMEKVLGKRAQPLLEWFRVYKEGGK